MKSWGQIRGQIRLILIYGEFPRLKLLLLTKPNIHPCHSGSTDSRDTILTQGSLGDEAFRLPIGAERGSSYYMVYDENQTKIDLARPLYRGEAPPPSPQPPWVRIVPLMSVNPKRHECILGLVNSKSYYLGNSHKLRSGEAYKNNRYDKKTSEKDFHFSFKVKLVFKNALVITHKEKYLRTIGTITRSF